MKKVIAFLFLISLCGCITPTITTLKTAAPRPEGCEFDIYASEDEVSEKYETLCIIEATTRSGTFGMMTIDDAIVDARPAVCKCGADAAILVEGASQKVSGLVATIFTPAEDISANVKLKGIRFTGKK